MLAIIPARAGSKGIPGKALRTVGGVPLILRTLQTVEAARIAERIIVSTDCPEVESFCRLRGYEVLRRPDELGADDVPIMDVAMHVVEALGWTGTAAIFQATCPLLEPKTVRDVVAEYERRNLDWAITVTADPRIHWRTQPLPHLLTDRKQRQQLAEVHVETGAVQIFEPVKMAGDPENRREGIITIPERQALDIDTPDDLMLAERLASLKRIHFVVLMGQRVGTGHFHRSLALAQSLSHHSISWEWRGDPPPEYVARVPYPETADGPIDAIIFDCLRPGISEVLEARSNGIKVIALEDESGDDVADLTVNDMLDPEHVQYAVLRPEFLCLPEREIRDNARNVLVTFGGTDPAGMGRRCARLLSGDSDVVVRQITPAANAHMAEQMRWADLVVTSQGRTVLEAAVAGTPCISVAANEREHRHIRIPGVTYLGLHSTVIDLQLLGTIYNTLGDRHLREENAHAAREAVDGRGLERLTRKIEELIAA